MKILLPLSESHAEALFPEAVAKLHECPPETYTLAVIHYGDSPYFAAWPVTNTLVKRGQTESYDLPTNTLLWDPQRQVWDV